MNAFVAAAAVTVAALATAVPADVILDKPQPLSMPSSECFVEAGYQGVRMPQSTLVADLEHKAGARARLRLFGGSEQYGVTISYSGDGPAPSLVMSVVDLADGLPLSKASVRADESAMLVASADGVFSWHGRPMKFDSLAVQCHPKLRL